MTAGCRCTLGRAEFSFEKTRPSTNMSIGKIGILGCGLMGRGIAEVAAMGGFSVKVREISDEALAEGLAGLKGSVDKAVKRGRIPAEKAEAAIARVSGTTELADLADCDLVIEAIVENLDAKVAAFVELDAVLAEDALLATNTSSLTVTQLAAATSRPDRFLGLHFFNPVPAMKLVEIVGTLMVSDSTMAKARRFVEGLGKEAVLCGDNSGFIVNRLLVPYLLDCVRAHENGVGSLQDIDASMRLGCGHPMGPFALLDFIGLDTILSIANIMFAEYRETRFAPPPLLKQMVQAGRLGRKSGQGFFDYRIA